MKQRPTMKEVRQKTGLSQAVFGLLVGLSDKAVSRIETGGRPPTLQQRESVALVNYLFKSGQLDDYAQEKFGINIRRLRRVVKIVNHR